MKTAQALAASIACAALAGIDAAAAPGPRSQDDRGFSITLVSPTDIYLTGRRTMRIEPIIPRGDSIEQVDFFIDGRLAFIDVLEPYVHEADFGDDIRRHAIEVRALTHQGRRAKVSMVSRSADLSDGAVGRVETLSAMVRTPAGRPVDGLSVSDFLLREDGATQPLVHFEGGGSPSSLALVLAPGEFLPFRDVNDQLVFFLRRLPRHHAVLVVEGAPAEEKPGGPGFSYDLEAVANRLRERDGGSSASAEALADRLARAVAALTSRRGARVLLVLAAGDSLAPEIPETVPPAPAGPPAPAPAAPPPLTEPAAAQPLEPGPLERQLQAAQAAGAVVYLVTLVSPGGSRGGGRLEAAAQESGGRFLPAADLPELGQALATVDEALGHRYLISYMPADPERAGTRRIDISVRVDSLSVEAPQSRVFP